MTEQLARQPDLNYFKSLQAGDEVRLYLADQHIPSFLWIHDRVEKDLVYGRIQFEGYSRLFHVQAYLCFDGYEVRLSCSVFETDAGERVDLPSDGRLFLRPPMPSQHAHRGAGDFRPLRYAHLKDPEIAKLQAAVSQLAGAGLKASYLFGHDVRTCYALNQMKGGIDFTLESDRLKGSVMIRKYRKGGLFSPALWLIRVTDYSNRSVQPEGWGKDGILIFPSGTEIISRRRLSGADEVVKALLEGADLLVSRNQ